MKNSIPEVESMTSSQTIANATLAFSGGEYSGHYFTEAGKSWWQTVGKSIFRVHDAKFCGMRFEHKRCPFCNRITSIHTLHWLNHLDKCAPEKYSMEDLMRLQHRSPEEYEKTKNGSFLGRK